MLYLITFVAIVLELILLLSYNLSPWCYGAFVLTLFEVFIVYKKRVKLSVAGWWLYIYIICSFLVIAAFKFTPSVFTRGGRLIVNESFSNMAGTAVYVMMFYFLALIIFNRTKVVKTETAWTIYSPKVNIWLVFLLGFTLTTISFVLGIGKMGVENTRLPFHLSGIIQFCRTDLIPIMALCVYVNRKQNNKKVYDVLLLLFIWSLFETIVRFSKSAILFSFLPIVMYELLSSKNNFFKTIKPFIPVAIVVLLLYPVVENMRNPNNMTSWDDTESEITGTFANPDSKNFLVKPFNRSFLTGYLYAEDSYLLDKHNIFDFRRVPLIIWSGGSARFQTFIVDGYPEGISHSSGTTPFVDAMLLGGYGLLFVSIFIMVYLAEVIDRKYKKKSNYIIVAILCVAYYRLFDMPLFTFFINEMSIRYLIVYAGICLYITYKWRLSCKSR